MFVLDSHCDTPSQILRLRDLSLDNDHAHVDFPKLARGGVDGAFFAIYVPASLGQVEAEAYADLLLERLNATMEANQDKAAYAQTSNQAFLNKEKGLFSVFIGLENGSPLGTSLEKLQKYYDQGVRYMTLCHSADNEICDSCAAAKRWGGLSPFGKTLIPEMNRIGMMIDLAHSSDQTMKDVLELSSKPVAYTHGCCRALASHRRNISDEMLRALADNGGVACMSIYPCFLDDDFLRVLDESGLESKMWIEDEFIKDPSDPMKRRAWEEVQMELCALARPSIARVVDHIEHAVNVAGIEHVGIGTDYDGIEVTAEGLETIAKFGSLWDEMTRRGFSAKEQNLIAGKNLLRVLKDVRRR